MIQQSLTAAALLLFAVGHPQAAQQPPPAAAGHTGTIVGTLTSSDRGEPIRKAAVRLVSTSPRSSRSTTTDGEGRFAFADLPPAEYTLSATRPGFLEFVYGAQSPGPGRPGTPIRLAQGQKLELKMQLPRGGVITGIVTDEFGDPAFNVPVRALRLAFSNGERIVSTTGTATTDDLGAYRIAGLLPGEYLVTAVPRDTVASAAASADMLAERMAQLKSAAQTGRGDAKAELARIEDARSKVAANPPSTTGYVPVYHPGTPMAATALRVQVGLSQQVFGIDIRLQIVETTTVSGVVQSAEGVAIPGNVQLVDPAMPVAGVGVWFRYLKDGSFSFAGVVPGSYVLRGNNSPPGTIGGGPATGGPFQMSMPAPVHVGTAAVRNLEVRMQPGLSVSGSLDLRSLTAPVDLSRVRVSLDPVTTASDWEMGGYPTVPDAEGKFAMQHVVPSRYRVAVAGLPEGWKLESAMFNGSDAADLHLTIEPGREFTGGTLTFTNRHAEISGALTNPLNAPVPLQSVVLFPANREWWVPQSRRIHVVLTGADGRYAFRDLPAGEYRLAAVTEIEAGQQFDRDFLGELFAASVAVKLGAGERKTQDIRIR